MKSSIIILSLTFGVFILAPIEAQRRNNTSYYSSTKNKKTNYHKKHNQFHYRAPTKHSRYKNYNSRSYNHRKPANHYIRRIGNAPIRRFPNYPTCNTPRYNSQNTIYRRNYRNNVVYRTPTIYRRPTTVYTYECPTEDQEPSCSENNTTYIYNTYEYIDENPDNEIYYEESFPNEEERTNYIYIEKRPTEEPQKKANVETKQEEENLLQSPIKDFYYYLKTGKEYFKRGHYEKAAKEFSQAALLDQYSYAAKWGHGMSMFALGKYSSASYSIRKGFELISNPFAIRENLRNYYQDISLFDQHLANLNHYLETYPFDLDAHLFNAFTNFYTKNYPTTQKILDHILNLDPQDPHALKLRKAIQQEIEKRKQFDIPLKTLSPLEKTGPDKETQEFEDKLLEAPIKNQESTDSKTNTEIDQEIDQELEKELEKEIGQEISDTEISDTEISDTEISDTEISDPTTEESPKELTETEKKQIIEENNAKALENYEKILENAKKSKKNRLEQKKPREKQPPPAPKIQIRSKNTIKSEIKALNKSFRNEQLELLSSYTEIKRKYYEGKIPEPQYHHLSTTHTNRYNELQERFSSKLQELHNELTTAK